MGEELGAEQWRRLGEILDTPGQYPLHWQVHQRRVQHREAGAGAGHCAGGGGGATSPVWLLLSVLWWRRVERYWSQGGCSHLLSGSVSYSLKLRSYEYIQNGVSVDCDSIQEDDEEDDEGSGDVMSGTGGSVVR